MPARLAARLRRLEAQAQDATSPLGEGLSGVLAAWRGRDTAVDTMPLAALSDAELHEQMTALAGARGLSICLREHLEEERARRQAQQAQEPPA